MFDTRPTTKAHRDIWATMSAVQRQAARHAAQEHAAAHPGMGVWEVWEAVLSTTPAAPAPQAKSAKAARVDRLQAAEAERKTLTEWERNGSVGDRPATPNLDNLREGGKPKATKAAPAEAPPVADGTLAVTLRGKAQPDMVRDTLQVRAHHTLAGVHVDDHDRLLFTPETAQALVDALRPSAEAGGQYQRRSLENVIIQVRHLAPHTTDPQGGVAAKAIDAMAAGKVGWAPVTRNDGSTVFQVDGDDEHLTAREVWRTYGPKDEQAVA